MEIKVNEKLLIRKSNKQNLKWKQQNVIIKIHLKNKKKEEWYENLIEMFENRGKRAWGDRKIKVKNVNRK